MQQNLAATDEELEAAFNELENLTYATIDSLEGLKLNYSQELISSLSRDLAQGRIALDKKISDLKEQVTKIVERSQNFDNLDIGKCTSNSYYSGLDDYRTDLLKSLQGCLSEKHTLIDSTVNTNWGNLMVLSTNFLSCSDRSIRDCSGNDACSDLVLDEINFVKVKVSNALNLMGASILNSVDGFSRRCIERSLSEADYHLADVLEVVTGCVNNVLAGSPTIICEFSK